MSAKKILEIACFNLESAIIAEEAGADRIELCHDYASGGTTPEYETIYKAKNILRIPIHVIIRPRSGDFNYSAEELQQMKKDILFCRQHNINGVVFGCLTTKKEIDFAICKELMELAKPMSVTFHRAIDECKPLSEKIKGLVKIGFQRVLTSGGKKNAEEGKNILNELNKSFENKIIILPGGGIRSSNISEIVESTSCTEYHSAALLENSEVCDKNEIKKLKKILNSA